jgi:adenylate cyclase class 2
MVVVPLSFRLAKQYTNRPTDQVETFGCFPMPLEPMPLEVEQKYAVSSLDELPTRLQELGAVDLGTQMQCDTYLRHPSRDFRATDEALRIREIDAKAWITYKGPRMPGPVKTRPEMEFPLEPTPTADWLKLWRALGFQSVAQVRKSRRSFDWNLNGWPIQVALDQVVGVGSYVEIETLVEPDSPQVAEAQSLIDQVAVLLGLESVERRSYLTLVLARQN